MGCRPRETSWVLVATLLTGLTLVGCGEESEQTETEKNRPETNRPTSPEEGVVEHPVEERIPYANRDIISITKDRSFEALPDPPRSLQVLHVFLQNPGAVDTTRLGFYVKESENVEVASLGERRLIILDGHPGNRLFEYDSQSEILTQIAAPGNGPGELKFSMGLMRDGHSVYVARQDRRIDRFTCTPEPCEYEATTRVPVNTMSVARASDGLAILAQPSNRKGGASMDELDGAVHLVSADGAVWNAFGALYHTEHFMVMANYARGGTLTYSPEFQEYLFSSEKLPYIWRYDEGGDVRSVYKVGAFRPLQMQYFPNEGRLHKEFGKDYSTLRVVGPVAGRFVVPVVRHYTSNGEGVRTERLNYYAIDLNTDKTYFLGEDTFSGEVVERTVVVTDEHQVLIENGAVALIESM